MSNSITGFSGSAWGGFESELLCPGRGNQTSQPGGNKMKESDWQPWWEVAQYINTSTVLKYNFNLLHHVGENNITILTALPLPESCCYFLLDTFIIKNKQNISLFNKMLD